MFYSNLYRRHLLDMHIDDWDPSFLSQFSPEIYVENLKKANINYAMLYLQSHAGLCYYPTETGVIHKTFESQPNQMKQLLNLCHQNDIKVIGYYSLVYNTREHDRHPQWRMVQFNGKSRRETGSEGDELDFASTKLARYGLCCPSNPDYREFVYAQIDEILAYFDCDALFFDMPFWPHTCHCKHCRKAFGKSIPTENTRELIEFKARMMGEFIQSVTDHVKMLRPDMPVEHNFAQAVAATYNSACMEEVLAACDYVGGDLYGDLYNHSFACKFYKNATKNQPFEQMLSRCKPALRMHTLNKTHDQLKAAVSSTMQHHGATLIIDAIDPVGTMDSRVYAQIGKIFDFQANYEPYFTGKMVEQVGLYYGLRSRTAKNVPTSLSCCTNTGKTLIKNHIPFGVTGAFSDLNPYQILIAPLLSEMEEKDNQRLIDYVRQGGTLYLSGSGNPSLVETLTGNRCLGITKEVNVYVAPEPEYEKVFLGFNEKYPLPFEIPAAMVEPQGAEVIATLTFPYTLPNDVRFASIHSNPPGVPSDLPAVTVNSFGKGTVIWSALPFEAMGWDEYQETLLNLIHLKEKPSYFFITNAPANVELTAFQNPETVTLCATVLDEAAVSMPVAPFQVTVRCDAKAVRLLPNGKRIPFTTRNGSTTFQTRKLRIFDMYEIIL